jgi:hypothetical protein
MTQLMRVTAEWSGFSGAPGYTVLHFVNAFGGTGGDADATAAAALTAATRTRTFIDAIKGLLPPVVRVTVSPEVEVIESTTGALVKVFSVTAPAAVVGTSTANYSAPNGAVISWSTAGIRRKRRIRGRTFLVPLASSSYGTDGNLGAGSRTTIQTAANALIDTTGDADMVIFGRPTPADKANGIPQLEDGTYSIVTSGNVPSMVAVLRSRRD